MSIRPVKAITKIESDMHRTIVTTLLYIKDLLYPVGRGLIKGPGPFQRCGGSDNSIILPSPVFLESMKKECSVKEFSTSYISTETMCREKGESGYNNTIIWFQYFNKEKIDNRPVEEACFERKMRDALIDLIYPQFTQVGNMIEGRHIIHGVIFSDVSQETDNQEEPEEVEIHISLGEN